LIDSSACPLNAKWLADGPDSGFRRDDRALAKAGKNIVIPAEAGIQKRVRIM
jgi:hypothetical protein